MAPFGVGVVSINPGTFGTEMAAGAADRLQSCWDAMPAQEQVGCVCSVYSVRVRVCVRSTHCVTLSPPTMPVCTHPMPVLCAVSRQEEYGQHYIQVATKFVRLFTGWAPPPTPVVDALCAAATTVSSTLHSGVIGVDFLSRNPSQKMCQRERWFLELISLWSLICVLLCAVFPCHQEQPAAPPLRGHRRAPPLPGAVVPPGVHGA